MMEVETDILDSVINSKRFHRHVPEYGSRAWLAEGEKVNVIYWDTGNGWCVILDVIPKNGYQKEVIKFYKKLKREILKTYDLYGFRYG